MPALRACCLSGFLSSRISQSVTLMRGKDFQHLTGSGCCRLFAQTILRFACLSQFTGIWQWGYITLQMGFCSSLKHVTGSDCCCSFISFFNTGTAPVTVILCNLTVSWQQFSLKDDTLTFPKQPFFPSCTTSHTYTKPS